MGPLHVALFVCIASSLGHSAHTIDNEDATIKVIDYRLPTTVFPSYYKIHLTPYLLASDENRFTFDGVVEITVKTNLTNLRTITLQAKDITFHEASIRRADDENELAIHNITEPDTETNKFDINLGFAMETNVDYIIMFNYSGKIGDDNRGFYRSKYTNANKEEVWIASTHFQTNNARRAFPSFDEPKFKAKFKIEITYPDTFDAISNTLPEQATELPTSRKIITVFKETPIMSSYLIAFIISNFRSRGDGDFRVYARPEAYNQTQYAYEVGPKLFNSLIGFTDYAYDKHGLGKMYLAGIPDFAAGAMENWGLLTYRETSLLYDSEMSTLYDQQRVAMVVSHELAHQWFGDLVTCDWWGYTWLNEGFGRYFHYFTINEVAPEWDLEKQFVVERTQTVMVVDSLPGTTPMSDAGVGSPCELSRMFNSISYDKGASILRMVEHLISFNDFRQALRNFIQARAFQTSMPQHLFDAFSQQWTNDISSLMVDWTEQVGYPVVTIILEDNGKSFTITQKRFLLREDSENKDLLYQVPLTYTTNEELNFYDTKPYLILPKSNVVTKIVLDKPIAWIIANIQETGYYRVNYDETTWKSIRAALGTKEYGKIHELNRAQIVDDVFNFGRAGLLDYQQVIDIVGYLEDEINYLPWYAAFQGYSFLTTRLGLQNQKYFKTYILRLLATVYRDVGFNFKETEKRLVTYNRANVLSWACKYGHEECVRNSQRMFKSFTQSGTPVEVNIRSVVYCTAIRNGGPEEFNILRDRFLNENVATEQVLLLNALGCSNNRTQIHEHLDFILADSVRLQDKLSAFTATYTNNIENVDFVWDFVSTHHKQIIKAFGTESTAASIISGIASRFTSHTQKQALEKFISDYKNDFGASSSTLTTALNNVNFNIKWADEKMKPFVDHIKALGDSATSITISTLLILFSTYMVAFLFNSDNKVEMIFLLQNIFLNFLVEYFTKFLGIIFDVKQ